MAVITDYTRANRRNEWILGGIVGVVVVLAVVLVTILVTAGGDETPAEKPGADARQLTADTCAAKLRQPTWVPESVMRAEAACPEDIADKLGDSAAPDRLGTWVVYDLHGPQNEESLPGAAPGLWPDAEIASGAIHPATTITYVAYPGSEAMTQELGGDTIRIEWHRFPQGGGEARVTQVENNGYGPLRVEWKDEKGSYLLLTVRGRTPDGRSGASAEELLRMAGSLAG